METSSTKVASKWYDVLPSAYHVPNPTYVGCVGIGGKNYWTDYCETKEEAWSKLEELKLDLGYMLIKTKQDEGYFPERAKLIKEKYDASGRTNGLYSGLNMNDGTLSNNAT